MNDSKITKEKKLLNSSYYIFKNKLNMIWNIFGSYYYLVTVMLFVFELICG